MPMATPVRKVLISFQLLELWDGDEKTRSYPISTSMFGTGNEEGSLRTPLGTFKICEKYGKGQSLNTIFKGRKPMGQWTGETSDDDLILGRILRLSGLEEHNENTFQRFIYIHGTNHEATIGSATSHGCIRMKRHDVASLYEIIPTGSLVHISAT